MQKELAKSYKKGNKELCAPSVSLSEITAYCNKNFNTDPDENKDCKDKDQYCLICCNNEFGSFTNEDRLACTK
jgi:hypothetical protein